MIKKYLTTAGFIAMLFMTNANANTNMDNNCILRDDILPVYKYNFQINNVDTLIQKQPEQKPCTENVCPVQNEEQVTATEQNAEKFSPCEELQRKPSEILKQTIDNKDIKDILTYYETADLKLNLSEEQKVKSDEIKQNAIKQLVETNQAISEKEAEILSLQTQENKAGAVLKIKLANNHINKLRKNIEKIEKQLDKEYFSMLTDEQKAIYTEYKQGQTAK